MFTVKLKKCANKLDNVAMFIKNYLIPLMFMMQSKVAVCRVNCPHIPLGEAVKAASTCRGFKGSK